jgi:iron complex outermembrane receptor protein
MLISVNIGSVAAQSTEEEDLALVYGDKANISIATGSTQTLRRAPAVATVITSQDIEAMGATDLDQALASVPGLHVSMSNVALIPFYEFRGIATKYNSQVLMMVNGISITNVFAGDRGRIWGGMPLENVARIEIIRGPGSALYGADAFSGVINIITKTAADIKGTETGVRAGSFNTKDAWIQHGGKLGSLDAALYLSTGNTDGHRGLIPKDKVSRSGPLNTEHKAIDAHADLSKDAWRLRTTIQKRTVGAGTGLGGALDPNERGQSTRLYLDLNYEQADWAPNWDVSGVVGYFDIKETGDPYYTLVPAGVSPSFPNGMLGNPGHSERSMHASASTVYTGLEQHRVRIGTGYRQNDMYEVTETKNFGVNFAPLPGMVDASNDPALVYMLPHKRNLTFAFIQDEWNLAQDWTLTAGVRHDNYSDFGGTTNPRFALVWDAAYNVVVKAMHGTAFRPPTFSDLYAINNPVTIGNLSLQPETITTDELAFSWQPTSTLQTNLNFFKYRMSSIITPVGTSYLNTGGQTGRGLEFETTLDASSSLRLAGNYSLQHSTDEATGMDAGMAPHRRYFVQADWRFMPLWQLGTTVNRVEGRMREPGDTRALIPDYTLVNLTLRREKFASGWDARAMLINLFDQNAWEPTFKSTGVPSDLPLSGRALYLQLQYSY